ncbi:hypothetical protein BOTNAR_0131g00090 [Botryotinia narcissicola]|uniref:Rhodopsin domain-containing protein n=1 Tax=Botryotinia narcissicola TaxID=278944 RepID=A0A4Z1IWQ9_9HELO|nr:hypothetical protein BOTNAR_0131g00090 [Botryotinia narcissicola]
MATFPPGTDLSHIPLAENPYGDPPNFINPINEEGLVLSVGLPLIIISFIVVNLRISTNLKVGRKLFVDDCKSLHLGPDFLYWLFCFGFKETARHDWDIPISAVLNPSFAKRIFAFNILSSPTFGFSKAAIIFLILRVFSPKAQLRWSCYTVLTVTLIYWVQIPLTIAWCTPHLHGHWDAAVSERCEKLGFTGPMQGVISVVTDVAILLLPLPIIFGLNLNRKRKMGLALVFFIAIFALVASSISMYYRVKSFQGVDSTWDGPKVTACAVAESCVTIIVSCAPSMASFWNNVVSKSAFYSSLRLSFTRSNSTQSVTGKSGGKIPGQFLTPESSSNLIHSERSYFELQETAVEGPQTVIRSDIEMNPVISQFSITKSTTIRQSTE